MLGIAAQPTRVPHSNTTIYPHKPKNQSVTSFAQYAGGEGEMLGIAAQPTLPVGRLLRLYWVPANIFLSRLGLRPIPYLRSCQISFCAV